MTPLDLIPVHVGTVIQTQDGGESDADVDAGRINYRMPDGITWIDGGLT